MFTKQNFKLAAVSVLTLLLSACTSSSTAPVPSQPVHPIQVPAEVSPVEPPAPYQEEVVDLSGKSTVFHSGMNDGCATAKGKYTKDSTSYSNEADYKEGWFYGRRKCQPHRAS